VRAISRLFRAVHDRVRLRGWIALFLVAAAILSLPRVASSRFVAHHRAAFHLKRAQEHLASRKIDHARTEFRAALRLQPGNAEARRELAAMELAAGNWELAFLEFQSLTEMHPEDPDGWIGLANLMVQKSGWLEAPEAALDKAITAAPRRADARLLRGDIRFRLGRYYGSWLDARAATADAPKDAAAWALLVRSTARSHGVDAGIEAASRGISAVGRDPALLLPFAYLLTERGRSREAADILEEISGDREATRQQLDALFPAPAPPRRLRADAHTDRSNFGVYTREHWPGRLAQTRQELEVQLQQQNWTEAGRIVESARRTYPQSTFGPFLAGVLELARGNTEEAERQFYQAMSVAPRFPTVVAAMARTWSRKKGAAFAGEQLMRLAEGDPQFAFARYMAARAYVEARDPIHAEAALTRGFELQPQSPVPYQHLVDYYFGLDRAAEALGICQRGLDRFPHDPDLQMMLAQINAAVGKIDDAIRAYEQIMSRRPDLDLVHYKLALLLASQEKDEEARQRLLQIVQQLRSDKPSDPLMLDTLGWAHYRVEDTHRARELLEAAVKGAPEEPGPHFHLAAVYAREKKTDLARKELNAALDSHRPFPERLDALRLLRENSPAPTPKGNARVSSARR
jgi:tetratricopeptide (TPR) repeat protein